MNNDLRTETVTRDNVLKLLSDDEVASVSTAETAPRLLDGEEYLDLEHLDRGVQRQPSLPRSWRACCRAELCARTPGENRGPAGAAQQRRQTNLVRILNEEAHDLCVDGCSPLPSVDCAGSNSRPACRGGYRGTWRKGRRIRARRRLREEHAELRCARGSHPRLAEFEGGGGGIWIGTGALVVLAIVLIVVFVH